MYELLLGFLQKISRDTDYARVYREIEIRSICIHIDPELNAKYDIQYEFSL